MRSIIPAIGLIIILAGFGSAQSEPKAYKFAEFGPMSKAGVRKKVDAFVLDPSRITFVDGGSAKSVRTVMWIVPEGAKPPTP